MRRSGKASSETYAFSARRKTLTILVLSVGLFQPAPSIASDAKCGYYAILGCAGSEAEMIEKQNILRNLSDDGTTRTKVVNTNNYPNFRDGWFCLVDGPFSSLREADRISLDWGETVGESYAKKGC